MPCAETAAALRCAVPPTAPPRKGRYAYVLSLAGHDPQSWQDYTRATLVAARALRATGTSHDVVVMLPTKAAARVPKFTLRLLRRLEARVEQDTAIF